MSPPVEADSEVNFRHDEEPNNQLGNIDEDTTFVTNDSSPPPGRTATPSRSITPDPLFPQNQVQLQPVLGAAMYITPSHEPRSIADNHVQEAAEQSSLLSLTGLPPKHSQTDDQVSHPLVAALASYPSRESSPIPPASSENPHSAPISLPVQVPSVLPRYQAITQNRTPRTQAPDSSENLARFSKNIPKSQGTPPPPRQQQNFDKISDVDSDSEWSLTPAQHQTRDSSPTKRRRTNVYSNLQARNLLEVAL